MILASSSHALRLNAPPEFNSAECEAKFQHLSDEMRRMLDYPELMCTETLVLESKEKLKKEDVVHYFPKHWKTQPDPEHTRTHIIVEGPESSGSHFMMRTIAG